MTLGAFIIDPQRDFHPGGSLAVEGADLDAQRAAGLITRLVDDIDAIAVTLDTHAQMDIAHPLWFVDAHGDLPQPFTTITAKQVEDCEWYVAIDDLKKYTIEYLQYVESTGKSHTIWPVHCVAGTVGHTIDPTIFSALTAWEVKNLDVADFVYKGDNPMEESFSAVRALSPVASPRHEVLDMFRTADEMLVFGQALSHCVAETCRDLVKFLSKEDIATVHLVTDCTSPVAGFEDEGKAFLREWEAAGGKTTTSEEFRA